MNQTAFFGKHREHEFPQYATTSIEEHQHEDDRRQTECILSAAPKNAPLQRNKPLDPSCRSAASVGAKVYHLSLSRWRSGGLCPSNFRSSGCQLRQRWRLVLFRHLFLFRRLFRSSCHRPSIREPRNNCYIFKSSWSGEKYSVWNDSRHQIPPCYASRWCILVSNEAY